MRTEDGDWEPCDLIDRALILGLIIMILALTIVACDLWNA
jgi:hypothetical protein